MEEMPIFTVGLKNTVEIVPYVGIGLQGRLSVGGKNPYKWSKKKLQQAVEEIHKAQFGESHFGLKNPMTLTVTPSGRIILSKVGGVPGPKARAAAEAIFGKGNVEFVKGGKGASAPGANGHHAEARAIQYIGKEAKNAKQATTHNACDKCAERQTEAGVKNVTGTAKENGGKVTR